MKFVTETTCWHTITVRIGRVHLTFNNCHWEPEGTHHGACSMPVLIAFKWCVLNMDRNFLGRRLWIYFRGGYACHFEFIADRRPV